MKLAQLYDKYVGHWNNGFVNLGLGALFAALTFVMSEGWPRDIVVLSAGMQLGYAFMWFTYPRFSAARKREMEAEMSLVMSSALNRMTREALGVMKKVAEMEDPRGPQQQPRRLQ